jgi:hypothetical protein
MADRKPTPREQAAIDGRTADIENHKRFAWELAKGDPELEELYRSELGEPPE